MKSDTYIQFTPDAIDKLHFICKSICTKPNNSKGHPTKKELLHGLVDANYASALQNMYEENLITDEELQDGIERLPDFLQERVKDEIEAEI